MIKIAKKKLHIFIIIFIFFIFFIGVLFKKTDTLHAIRIHATLLVSCNSLVYEHNQIDCVFETIEKEMRKTGNVSDGMRIFAMARNDIRSFNDDTLYPCHLMLHAIGDIAYRVIYSTKIKVSNIYFPQETSGCDYGFFHGFVEHIGQDNPDPVFTNETCQSLIHLLEERMGYILDACFHSVGHGFMLSQMEKMPQEQWGDFQAMTQEPLFLCGQLLKPKSKRYCWAGIFHWILFDEYGLYFSGEEIISQCDRLEPKQLQGECYAWSIHSLVFNTPDELLGFIKKSISDIEIQQYAFYLSIAQMQINNERPPYGKMLAFCMTIEDVFYESCIKGLVKGLVGAVNPQDEYRDLLPLCSEPIIQQRDARALCYDIVFKKLLTLYAPERIISICRQFPADVRDECRNSIPASR